MFRKTLFKAVLLTLIGTVIFSLPVQAKDAKDDAAILSQQAALFDSLQDSKTNQEAVERVNKIIDLSPDSAYGCYARTLLDDQLNNAEKIKLLSNAVESKPDFFDAYSARARLRMQLKDYDKAISDYGSCISLRPKNANMYYNRGYAYERKHDYAGSIGNFGKAIELSAPDTNIIFYTHRGNALIETKDYANATKDYLEAVKMDDKNAEAYENLAFIAVKTGDQTTAKEYMKKSGNLYCDMGEQLMEKGKTSPDGDGVRYLTKAVEMGCKRANTVLAKYGMQLQRK